MHHRWDISPRQAVTLQKQLAGKIRLAPLQGPIETVAGTDCAFLPDGRIIAGAVLLDARTMETLEEVCIARPCGFPYVSGLLSFREAPAVIEVIGRLGKRPDLLMCDGQGVAHPRGLGLASHVGLWVDLPTIGVAKSRLCGQYRPPASRRRSATQLRLDGTVVGKVVRTRDGVRPLFVSPGHRVTLDDAVRWVLRCTRGVRLPEPTRCADRRVGQRKREILRGG